jgi:plastocyanin
MGHRVLAVSAVAAAALAASGAVSVAVAAPAAGRVVGTVAVTEADGKPAAAIDAIVYVVGFSEKPEKTDAATATVAQQGRHFVPDLVAITAGETVTFPNNDPFYHNVFSVSAARKFDLGSFKKGEHKDKEFPDPGVVDVYCNIHPEMAATILVLPNRRHTRTQTNGAFTLDGVPPGDWTVFAYTRRAAKPVSAKIKVTAGADTKIDLALQRGAEPAHMNKFGEKYKPGSGSGDVYK